MLRHTCSSSKMTKCGKLHILSLTQEHLYHTPTHLYDLVEMKITVYFTCILRKDTYVAVIHV